MKEAVQKLTPFIPQNLRLDILASLWEEYGDEGELAREVGCKPALMDRWLRAGEPPSDKYTPQILFLALQRSSRVREILRAEVLEQIEDIFAEIDVSHEEKTDVDLGRVLDAVDEKSRQILWYLWWSRHAEIGELVELTKADSDMDILSRIRDVINPAARLALGREIVKFESSRIDPVTGERVLSSWWLEDGSLFGKSREPLVDVFEEDGHVAIIAQLPASLQLASEAQVENKDGLLRIRVGKVKAQDVGAGFSNLPEDAEDVGAGFSNLPENTEVTDGGRQASWLRKRNGKTR